MMNDGGDGMDNGHVHQKKAFLGLNQKKNKCWMGIKEARPGRLGIWFGCFPYCFPHCPALSGRNSASSGWAVWKRANLASCWAKATRRPLRRAWKRQMGQTLSAAPEGRRRRQCAAGQRKFCLGKARPAANVGGGRFPAFAGHQLPNAFQQGTEGGPILGGDERIDDEASVAVDQRQQVKQLAKGQIDELVDIIGEQAVQDGLAMDNNIYEFTLGNAPKCLAGIPCKRIPLAEPTSKRSKWIHQRSQNVLTKILVVLSDCAECRL